MNLPIPRIVRLLSDPDPLVRWLIWAGCQALIAVATFAAVASAVIMLSALVGP